MKEIVSGVEVSEAFLATWGNLQPLPFTIDQACEHIATLTRQFRDRNEELLSKRVSIQKKVDEFFTSHKGKEHAPADVVSMLKSVGFIEEPKQLGARVKTAHLPAEILDIQGPQLVVPADKANMVLNAMNARFGALEETLLQSNILTESDPKKRAEEARVYRNRFLDSAVPLAGKARWNDVARIGFDRDSKTVLFYLHGGESVRLLHCDQAIGVNLTEDGVHLSECLFEHNRLKIEVRLEASQAIKDVWLESTLTFIIDLEDASLSAPAHKLNSYTHIKKLLDGRLSCDVRGEQRTINSNTGYLDSHTLQVKTLKRTALPLVREVGGHLYADTRLIRVDGKAIPEKILDCYITSLLGMRYHVVPKLHGAEEVAFTVELFEQINRLLGLPAHSNKIGIMNEEIRTNAQFYNAVAAAADVVFFTNSGFLDYTGSFIDLMNQQGAIAPYRQLAAMLYKTSYEENNVYVSLALGVPQIGAGMWAKIRDMKGLFDNKIAQVKALNDTGWSPSPSAATIHVLAYHLAGDVKELQHAYFDHPKAIAWEPMFTFPRAEKSSLSAESVRENIQYAIHGLLAYAEPWVRRGTGCSGVRELSGEPLMEDRATARIKTAFLRNWLLHGVIDVAQIKSAVAEMAKLVDTQNADKEGYQPIYSEALDNNVVRSVMDLILNPDHYMHSYVEPYMYAAYVREQQEHHGANDNVRDFMGDWDGRAQVK